MRPRLRTRVLNAYRALRALPPLVEGNPWANPTHPGDRWYHLEGEYPLRPGERRGTHPRTGEEVIYLPRDLARGVTTHWDHRPVDPETLAIWESQQHRRLPPGRRGPGQ
jgi:hypothetical protein